MLRLDNRELMLDALRAPTGYRFHSAIGTTYTLDLLALMQISLAFSVRGMSHADSNPLAKLSVLHKYIERITLFCHAGQIAAPRTFPPLYTYFEEAIHEVLLPDDGAFHPKIWCVRYESVNDPSEVRYHFLCLTRNLTFDRSWDTILILTGQVTETHQPTHKALGDFLLHLPELLDQPLSEQRQTHLQTIADEIQYVRFDSPEGIQSVGGFYPIVPGHTSFSFPQNADRGLFISPFVSPYQLKQLGGIAPSDWTLVTMPTSLPDADKREQFRKQARDLFVLTPAAEIEREASDNSLDGLHAKLYVFDKGDTAHIFTGSANATNAAFSKNVEFMVELQAESCLMGVNALLAVSDNEATLKSILHPMPEVSGTDETAQQHIETLLNRGRRALLQADIRVEYLKQASADSDDAETLYDAIVTVPSSLVLPDGVRAFIQVTSRTEQTTGVDMLASSVRIEKVPDVNLTTFFTFTLQYDHHGETHTLQFVHQLPVSGLPDDRRSRILSHLLRQRGDILRFLMMLLMDDDPAELASILSNAGQSQSTASGDYFPEDRLPLFEVMVKALDGGAERIDEVKRLIDELQTTEAGHDVLPDDFMVIWQPIWQMRQRMNTESQQ